MFGVSLFERRVTGVRLTNTGSRFVAKARSIVLDLREAVETLEAAGVAARGHLRIGHVDPYQAEHIGIS